MSDNSDLELLLKNHESPRLEFKSSPADGEKIRQAVCAYANDLPGDQQPGLVLIGVDDTGTPTGLPIDDRLLQRLSFIKDDGQILPLPQMTVERVDLSGIAIAVVKVWPSSSLPVRYRGQVWIRVGPRRAIATLEEERRLTERDVAATFTFDRRPCSPATLDDLDVESFRGDYLPRVVDPAVILENQRTIEYRMASLRFFDLRRGAPTHAGVLAFGRDPLNFLPGAYLQFVRYDGTDRAARVVDHRQITGKLREQLLQLDALLPIHIHSPRVPTSGLKHEDRPDYPISAIREFVLNAIMHRTYEGTNTPIRLYWYSDHVEIQSPGGLFGQVTPENFTLVNDYRNPVIAEVLRGLGYVERFGSGILRAQVALKNNGNPPAEFTFAATHVLVKITAAALL